MHKKWGEIWKTKHCISNFVILTTYLGIEMMEAWQKFLLGYQVQLKQYLMQE